MFLAGAQGPPAEAHAQNTGQWYGLRPLGSRIQALAMDPGNSQIIYAGTEGGQVSKSTNGGRLWTTASLGVNSGVTALAIDPSDSDTLYAATAGNGVFRSADGGTTWQPVSAGLTDLLVTALVIDPVAPTTLYAGTEADGVFKSTDGGGNWAEANAGLTDKFVLSLAVAATTPTTLYAGTDGSGVFKGANGGATWTAANAGLTGISVSALAVDPSAPDTVYAAAFLGGVFKTDNAGLTWAAANTGLSASTVYALAFGPGTIYAGTAAGVFGSSDGAANWSVAASGLNRPVLSVLVDPASPATVYAGTESGVFMRTSGDNPTWSDPSGGLRDQSVTVLAVDPQTPTTLYAGTYGGGVYKTTNGAATWNAAGAGLDDYGYYYGLYTLAIDPQTPTTLYAGTEVGAYKTTDGGATWSTANAGLSGYYDVFALAIDPQTPTTLYAGTESGAYKTTDGAATWSAASVGLGGGELLALAIDPQTRTTVYAGTYSGRVYRSRTAGATWRELGTMPGFVASLRIDPQMPDTIYALSSGSLFKTTDGGTTWAQSWYSYWENLGALEIDPQMPSKVYVGTSWYFGPAGRDVYESSDAGSTWTRLGCPLSVADSVLALAITTTDGGMVYAGTDRGVFFRRREAGPCLTDPTNPTETPTAEVPEPTPTPTETPDRPIQPCISNCASVSVGNAAGAPNGTVHIPVSFMQGPDDGRIGGNDEIAAIALTIGLVGASGSPLVLNCDDLNADGYPDGITVSSGVRDAFQVIVENLECINRARCLCPGPGETRDNFVNIVVYGPRDLPLGPGVAGQEGLGTIPGDANGDARLTLDDVYFLTREIFDGDGDEVENVSAGTLSGAPGSDANLDARVNAADTGTQLSMLLGVQPPELPDGVLFSVEVQIPGDSTDTIPVHIFAETDDQGEAKPVFGAFLSAGDTEGVDQTADRSAHVSKILTADGSVVVASTSPSPTEPMTPGETSTETPTGIYSTATPSATRTLTPPTPGSPVPTPTDSTFTPTRTITGTPPVTATRTNTSTRTAPATPTRTATRTPTSAVTPTQTFTRTPTRTFTQTRTLTPSPTPTVRVSGVVNNAVTGARLSGVALSLAGQSTTTGANGYYNFPSIDPNRGRTLTATRTGFNAYSATLSFPPGVVAITHDFGMAPQASKPVVTGISPQYDGLFVAALPVQNRYTATVVWNGTPGTVEFYANNQLRYAVNGTTSGGSATFNMGTDFTGSLTPGANRVRVIARNAEGLVSDPFSRNVTVLPLPPAVSVVLPQFQVQSTGSDVYLALDISVPQPPINQTISLPVIGRWGVEAAGNVSFDYTVRDGAWEAAIGAGAEGRSGKRGQRPVTAPLRSPRMKLFYGNKEASFSVQGGLRGTATAGSGIQLNQAFLGIGLGLKAELGRVGVLDLLSPGISTLLSPIPLLYDTLKLVSVIFYVEPQFAGEATFALNPQFAFQQLEASGGVGVSAAYEPNLYVATMRLYLGGRPSMTVGTPGQLIRQLTFRAYAGAEFQWWLIRLGPYEYVFVNRTVPGAAAVGVEPIFTIERVAHDGAALSAIPRDYLAQGPPIFTANDQRTSLDRIGATPLGQRQVSHQADLTLVENVFPNSQPGMAANGNELMLVYVSDNGMGGPLQRTDINWTRFDGTDWSAPQPILADTRAEFRPQVAFDATGDAIAVWERVKYPQFDTLDIGAMAAQMEVVWSRWDRTTGLWSSPVPLTDNAHLDHQPLLAGPIEDGSLLLAWTENLSDLPVGVADQGDASKDTVRWSRWNPETRSWSTPEVLVDHLAVRTSQAFAGAGSKAVYAWTVDPDGDPSDASDQELFHSTWTGSGWTAPARFTDDSIADQNVRAAVDAAGQVSLVWQRGADLVLDRNLAGNPTLARADSQTVAFADYAMTVGPNGNLVLLWQEQSESGVDAHYAVFDPASGRWSEDSRLFTDPELERSFAPVWDATGALTIAYNRVQITTGPKTVTTEQGEQLVIDDVPQPGRVELAVVKRALQTDIALLPGDFTAEGASFLPGSSVTLRATVRNAGDLPLEKVEVAFYDGHPSAGGVEILPRRTIAGFLDGGATAAVETEWIVPEPAMVRTLYALLDPDRNLPDADRSNNRLFISVGGTDLVARLIDVNVGADGSARVIVEVANQGAPGAPPSTLATRYADNPSGSPLATALIPALTPGARVELALDLPAGTVTEERLFSVTADAGETVGDIARDNNSVTFPMALPAGPDDATPTPTETPAASCAGDCNGDGGVSIDELIRGVNIALDNAPLAQCQPFDRNGDGGVTINELIAAVNNALNACP